MVQSGKMKTENKNMISFFPLHLVWFCEFVLVFTDVLTLCYGSSYESCSDLAIG